VPVCDDVGRSDIVKILSVSVGRLRQVESRGKRVRTSIFKEPVAGSVRARTLNLDGDEQSHLSVHGGPDKATESPEPHGHERARRACLLEKYFGLRSMGGGSEQMAGLFDDNGLSLVLMTAGRSREVAYPASFHLGFMQESEEQVNAINQRLQDDGFAVPPPRRLHGMWTFYFEAPGGFTIEVGR
jgi:lactoylglutathione lyase